jgi:hypothetical protein
MKNPELENDDLYQEIEERIDAIKSKKNAYTLCYRTARILTFLAGAAITILVGWQGKPEDETGFKNWVLGISTLITFIASIEGLFYLREKAMDYDVFLFELRKHRNKICYDFKKGIYDETKDTHFKEFIVTTATQKEIIEQSYGKGK